MADKNEIEELRSRVIGKNDDQIYSAVEGYGGTEALLEQVFSGMQGVFDAARAGDHRAVFQYDIDAPEGMRTFQIKVADGTCEIVKGAHEPARVTLVLSLPNFLRLVTGNLNGMQAFMAGQLKVKGDVMFAQNMQSWFPLP